MEWEARSGREGESKSIYGRAGAGNVGGSEFFLFFFSCFILFFGWPARTRPETRREKGPATQPPPAFSNSLAGGKEEKGKRRRRKKEKKKLHHLLPSV